MKTLREKKKKVLNRKWLFRTLFVIILIGLGFGSVMAYVLTLDEAKAFMSINVPLCLLICVAFIVFMWLPLLVADRQIYDLNEHGLTTLTKKGMFGKWKLILYVLCNDTIDPFLRLIPYDTIQSGEFSVSRHVGGWGFSRYTYLLKLQTKEEEITVFINPMDNGPFMPSGQGGFVLSGYKDRTEICNIISFLEAKGIPVGDPYHILDAFKQEDIEIYDYLESLQLKVKY